MRKLYILFLLMPFVAIGQQTYTSITNGDWNTSTTWNPIGIPGALDTVIINTSVTNYTGHVRCANIIINSGGVLDNSAGNIVSVFNLCNNKTGGKWKGAGQISFVGPKNGIVLTGGGDFSGQTGNWDFCGNSASGISTSIIDASVNIVKNGGYIVLYTGQYNHPVRIINFGKISFTSTGASIVSQGTLGDSWTQGTNSFLSVAASFLNNSYDTLVASASGNCIEYFVRTTYGFSIKQPIGNTYYRLHFRDYFTTASANLTFDVTVSDSLVIYPYGALDLKGHNVTIGGNWINNITGGTLKNLTGTVTFNGSSLQTIGGTHTTRFVNMTISGTGGVKLATGGGFTGVLTLNNSGNFTGPGVDTLISTSSATARVAPVTGSGTITANFVVERYLNRTSANYEGLSSPVQSTTIGDWDGDPSFWMSGTGGNDGNAIVAGKVYYSVKKYNELTNHFDSIPSDAFVIPKAFCVYLWMGNSLTSMAAFTYNTHGIPTVGNVTCNVTKTVGKGNGFNLVGNPYPSPLSWGSFKLANVTLQNTYYLFEQDGTWHTFTVGNLAMEQGFGVVTSAAAIVTFKENQKALVDASLLRESTDGDPSKELNAFTLTLSNDANTYSCPTIITFGNEYVNNYDLSEDALFITSPIDEVPQVYTTSEDNQNLMLNRLPDNNDVLDVPLTLVGNVAANYILSASDIHNVSSYNYVYLLDKQTGEVLNNFNENPVYSFAVSNPGEHKDYTLRFSRSAEATANNSNGSSTVYATLNGIAVNFNQNQAENAVISAYNTMGQKVMEDIKTSAFRNKVEFTLPANQLYTIRVETPEGTTIKKLYR